MTKAPRHSLPPLTLNVPALAGRSEAEVAEHLGPPDPGIASADPARVKHAYRGGTVEVVYMNGKATWIKAYGGGELPFGKEALSKLGLPVRRPTYVNAGHVMSWHNLPRLREVSLYGGGPGGSVSSVVVCVQTTSPAAARHAGRPRISLARLWSRPA